MSQHLLQVNNISKTFALRRHDRAQKNLMVAVDDVSFSIDEGVSLGIAGESGSGKSTLARMILGLEQPSSGNIRFDGINLTTMDRADLMAYRRQVQAVFQDSTAALNPRMRIRDIIAEPLQVQYPDTLAKEIDSRIDDLLFRVGLSNNMRSSFPHELSGGQKQRVAIARSLVINPRMLVLDEPVSALDVSVRSQVLNLLLDLQQERQLTYLMIAHDLAVLRHVTNQLVIMYLGRVVEQGPTEEVIFRAKHPYTQALVAASPSTEIGRRRNAVVIKNDDAKPNSGCAFAPRCPFADNHCYQAIPRLIEAIGKADRAASDRHYAACHKIDLNRASL